MTGALRQLFALSEAYPDLKANQNFLALQEELTSTESRVAYARQFYNDSVLGYHNQLDTFPTILIAKLGTFAHREFSKLKILRKFLRQSNFRPACLIKLNRINGGA